MHSPIGRSRLRRFCGPWLRCRRQQARLLPAAPPSRVASAGPSRSLLLIACAASTGWLGIARAADPAVVRPDEGRLQLYEPISAGYTKDSDDVPFLDVTLSLKFRLAPEFVQDRNYRLFLAFTTRFGFYLGTRESSPVIGKTYNPKLIWRYIPESGTRASSVGRANSVERRGYLDLAYAHESNGQSINTPEEYEAALREVTAV